LVVPRRAEEVAADAASEDTMLENEMTEGSVEFQRLEFDDPDGAPDAVDDASVALGVRIATEAMYSYCRT
jgi:hypothetical protein